jgi:uncharacterized protein (TIRG00374 family)
VFASIIRWKVLLEGQGMRIPLGFLAASFLEGRFFGSFLPSTIGLDTYRTIDLARYSKQTAASISVTLVDKVIGLFALSFLVLVTAGAGAQIVGTRGVLTLLAIFLVPLAISVWVLLFPGVLRKIAAIRWGRRWTEKVSQFLETLLVYGRRRGRLFQAMALGVVVHLGTTLMYYGTALTVGANVHLGDILFTGPIMITATVIPLSIAGIGVREGTFVFFLTRVGVPAESAVLLAFLGFLVDEFLSLIGGAIFALRSHEYAAEEAAAEPAPRSPKPVEPSGSPILAERIE